MKKKGQIFLITSVIFIAIIIILKISFNPNEIEVKRSEAEYNFRIKYFSNINKEILKSVEISYNQPTNITKNLFSFANFTRNKMNEKGFDYEIILITSVSPKFENILNVTVINLLNRTIDVNLTLNSTPQQSTIINGLVDYGISQITFNINQDQVYKLNAKYMDHENGIIIVTKNGKSIYTLFTDTKISDGEIEYKDKSQNSYNLP